MMRLTGGCAVVALVWLVGCSGGGSAGKGEPTDPDRRASSPRDAGVNRKASPPPAKGEIPFPECKTAPCVLHQGTGIHLQCLMGAPGSCAHFGAACVPDDKCMFDPSSKQYRACAAPGVGTCTRFGDPCQPSDACQLDPKDGRFRDCEEPVAGGCRRFSELCSPGSQPAAASVRSSK